MLAGILSALSALIPFMVFIRHARGIETLAARTGYYACISVGVELAVIIGTYSGWVRNNLPLLHLFTLVEFAVFLWCFSNIFSFLDLKVTALSVAFFVGLEVVLDLVLQPLNHYNTVMRSIEAVTFILLCTAYFYKTMKTMEVESLPQTGAFWFATALILYFSGNLVIFGFSNFMNRSTLIQHVWVMHSFLNILLNVLLGISIWKGRLKTN